MKLIFVTLATIFATGHSQNWCEGFALSPALRADGIPDIKVNICLYDFTKYVADRMGLSLDDSENIGHVLEMENLGKDEVYNMIDSARLWGSGDGDVWELMERFNLQDSWWTAEVANQMGDSLEKYAEMYLEPQEAARGNWILNFFRKII